MVHEPIEATLDFVQLRCVLLSVAANAVATYDKRQLVLSLLSNHRELAPLLFLGRPPAPMARM